MSKKELTKELNVLVSTWSVEYTKLHNYHWYVTGPSFFTLHAKFEELYNEISQHLDEYAERILSLGEKPSATLKEHLELSLIGEANGNESAEEMVQAIVNDFTTIMKTLERAMEIATEVGDDRTEDLVNGTYQSLEKHTWMLSAFLEK